MASRGSCWRRIPILKIMWILRIKRRRSARQPCPPGQFTEPAQGDETSPHSSDTPQSYFKFLDLPTELQLQVLANIELQQLRLMRGTSRSIKTFINEHASVLAAPYQVAARERLQEFVDYWLDYSRGDIDFLEALSRFLWRRRISTDLKVMCNILRAFTRYRVFPNPRFQRLNAVDPESAWLVCRDVLAITWYIFRIYISFQFPDTAFIPYRGDRYRRQALSQDSFINACWPYMPPEGYGIDLRSLQKWYNMITRGATTLPGVATVDIPGQEGLPDKPTITRLNYHPSWEFIAPLGKDDEPFFRNWNVPRFPMCFEGEFAYVTETSWAWRQVHGQLIDGKEVGPLEKAAVLMEMSIR